MASELELLSLLICVCAVKHLGFAKLMSAIWSAMPASSSSSNRITRTDLLRSASR
jgi:hypothetical protein